MSKLLVTIYQVKDEFRRDYAFRGLAQLKKEQLVYGTLNRFNMSHYEVVFMERDIDGMVMFGASRKHYDIGHKYTLEEIFTALNHGTSLEVARETFGYKGYSLSVGHIVQINGKFYYCDSIGWEEIDPINVPLGIEVGMGATLAVGTDRYPYHVVKISPSGKTIHIQRADFKAGKGHDYFGSQKWDITSNPKGQIEVVRKRKDGRYRTPNDLPVWFGKADAYQDPTF